MDYKYKVKVNTTSEFDFNETDISKANIIKIKNAKYHIIDNNKTYTAEVTDANFNKKSYQVKINNNTYNVNILNDLDILIKAMGFEAGSSKLINSIKAPMPGLILDINVKVDQEVKENDTLLILEAMKMENILISPRTGVIKFISVNKGDVVKNGQLLIEFE